MEHQGGEGVDAAEGAQPRDRRPQPLVLGQPGEPLIEGLAAGAEPVDGGELVDEGQLGGLVLEGLLGQPAAVIAPPGALARVDPPVAEQQL